MRGLGQADAILLASDLSQAGVSASLTSLSTALSDISGEGAQQLAAAVLAKPTLDVFSGIPLKELRANSLTTLDLNSKGLGVPEATVLADLLRSGSASLTTLNLANNQLFPSEEVPSELIGDSFLVGAKVRMKEGYKLTVLREADANGEVKIGDPSGIQAIADALKVTASVTSVNVLSNQLDVDSADLLLKVKAEKPNLRTLCGLTHEETELDLSGQELGPGDAKLLAPEISVIASVTKILVRREQLGDEGATILCDALRESKVTNVQELDLSHNASAQREQRLWRLWQPS